MRDPWGLVTKLTCAHCGTTGYRTVVYGYPEPEGIEEARRSNVILGGCEIGRSVVWFCDDCEREPDETKLRDVERVTASE